MITIAIDIGASFLKGARISADGVIEAYVERDAAQGGKCRKNDEAF